MVILVMVVTVNVSHAHQCLMFAFQAAGKCSHGSIIGVFSVHLFDPHQYSLPDRAFDMLTQPMPRPATTALCLIFCLFLAGCQQQPAGQLTEINRAFQAGLPALASPSIVKLVEYSQQAELKTDGRFNPAIGALVGLWGFHTSDYPIEGPPPAGSQIRALVATAPSSLDITIDGQQLTTSNRAVQLDFGGIAKGYAIDIACDHLKTLGINNAIVNAGGDLRAMGDHGSRPWRIAVRSPGGGIIGSLQTTRDEAVFTSGNYERFRQDQLQRYPHILDPRTGWPVQDVASVTVITRQGWLADAAATALIVAGLEEWQGVAISLGLDQVMLVDETGKAWVTEKMNERLEFVDGVEKEVVNF
jgi:thiamine biosynthesis lipoprotein